MRLGIIRVLTTDDRELLDQHGVLDLTTRTPASDTLPAALTDRPDALGTP